MAEIDEIKPRNPDELPAEGGIFGTPEAAEVPEAIEAMPAGIGDATKLTGFQAEKPKPLEGDPSPKQVEPFGGRPPMVETARARLNLNEFMEHLSSNRAVATSDEAAALQEQVNGAGGAVDENDPQLG